MFDGKGDERTRTLDEAMTAAPRGARRPDPVKADAASVNPDSRLMSLTTLSSLPIETKLVGDLSGSLHTLFDHVCENTLPIYFGPLLGRLYLEGL